MNGDFGGRKPFDPEEFKKMMEEEENEQPILVRPEEIKKEIDKTDKILNTEPNKKTALDADQKFSSKSGTVQIDLESAGRFGNPEEVYFSDYDVEDVNSLAMSREEDLLDNLLFILDKQKKNEILKVGNFTLEEFYEVMIGIKMQFNTTQHEHIWMCTCQMDLPEHRQKPSKQDIDLTAIRYVSIEEADDKLREKYREILKGMEDEDFKSYLERKYGSVVPMTREQELQTIKISEPLVVKEEDKTYAFNFTRIGDLAIASKEANKKYNWLIRKQKNKFSPGQQNNESYDDQMSQEVEKLKHEKAKYAILVSKACSLKSVNGKELTTLDEKIEEYKKLKRSTLLKLSTLLEMASHGVQHEFDLTCNICGKTERRSLRRSFSPFEFIPFDDDKKPGSDGKLRKHSEFDIFFGVEV